MPQWINSRKDCRCTKKSRSGKQEKNTGAQGNPDNQSIRVGLVLVIKIEELRYLLGKQEIEALGHHIQLSKHMIERHAKY